MSPTADKPTLTQQAAIDHDRGPALVLAGPGSGKTFVLVQRCTRLVSDGIPAETILLLTFNHNAAAQLRTRLRSAHLGLLAAGERVQADPDYQAFTYHAFAMDLVREFATFAGLPSAPRLVGTAAKWRMLREIVADLRPGHFYMPSQPTFELATIERVIRDAKREAVPPQRLIEWAERRHEAETPLDALKREKLGQIGRIYEEYVRRGRERRLFDFDDHILLALELLRVDAIRTEMAARYAYMMVDEYQDTSDTQSDLITAIASPEANLLVVADDDQSIYKFRGASRHNVLAFRQRYPACSVYSIAENRRSTPQIVRASLSIMAGRPNREEKALVPIKGDGSPVQVVVSPDLDSEAIAIADRIRADHDAGTLVYRDFAILARKRAHLETVAAALRERKVPFHFRSRRDYFRLAPVKAAVAMLRLALEPDDNQLYARLMQVSTYAVGTARFALMKEYRETGAQIRSLLPRAVDLGLSFDERDRFAHLVRDVEDLALLKDSESPDEVLRTALERSRYVGLLDEPDPLRQLDGFALLRKLTGVIDEFALDEPHASLGDCLEYLQFLEAASEDDEVPEADVERDAVLLSTIHGAKGLEFPHVHVAQLVAGELPARERADALALPNELVYHDEALPQDPHEEEERRLFYVACTRAMETLSISRARKADWKDLEPSPFLAPLVDHTDVGFSEARRERLREPDALEAVPFEFRIDAFNFTMIQTFRRCPRQFAYRYYYRLPQASSGSAHLGQLAHETLFQAAQRRLRGDAIGGDEVVGIFDELWDATRFDKQRYAALRDTGRDMMKRYGDSPVWRESELELIEHEFHGLPVHGHPFDGKIDRVDAPVKRDGTERRRLVDYKTGRPKLPEQMYFDDRLQLALYREAAARQTGTEQFDLEFHFLQDGSVVRLDLSETDISRTLYAAGKTADEIGEAVRTRQFPVKASAWNCPTCPYRAVCDEGKTLLAAEVAAVTVEGTPALAKDEEELPF
ncbi:MAG: ATP-dependent helicase [Chloroflexota bacterium]|nr:ATP-dependent helicase [Chloroflexota bacterium]